MVSWAVVPCHVECFGETCYFYLKILSVWCQSHIMTDGQSVGQSVAQLVSSEWKVDTDRGQV